MTGGKIDSGLRNTVATEWLPIICVVLAGAGAALHIGKGIIALPQISEQFALPLKTASWMMSIFPLIGVLSGMLAGIFTQRWGDKLLSILGLILVAIASAAGSFSDTFAWLLASRFIEGVGFVLVVVSAPAILNRLAVESNRNVIFAAWSATIPVGMAIGLLFGPLLGGWHVVWMTSAAVTLLLAILLLVTVPAASTSGKKLNSSKALERMRSTLFSRAPVILALTFATYSVQFFAVLTFLPVLLHQDSTISVATAGVISAAVMASNIIGNFSAGALLARSVKPSLLMMVCSMGIGITGAAVFFTSTQSTMAIILSFLFSILGGMLPSTILNCAPRVASDPVDVPLVIGLAMQGNYLGQAIAPVLVGTIVALLGWTGAAIPVGLAAIGGVILSLFFKRFDKQLITSK